ncbi:hypothetical protein ACFQV2_13855 [Actinokineospora soli]|uniref:Uncharacterized protein n=1 Tax=Actinokineospora soli TaxID=1048753 RepID=A0ABW2TMR7_9PSEU
MSERRLADKKHHLDRMIGLLDGRVYYRLDAWFALHGQIPAFPLVRPWWEQSMGLNDAKPPTRADFVRALPTVPGLITRLAKLRGSVRGFLAWWDDLVAGADGMDRWSPEELIAFHRGLWAQVGERWGITLMNSVYLLSWATATSALLRRWVGEDDKRIIGGLLLGGAENRSVLGVRSAIALAELVAADPVLAARVQDDPADEVWADIVAGKHGKKVAAAATEHLRRYGDRALHDLKLEEPSAAAARHDHRHAPPDGPRWAHRRGQPRQGAGQPRRRRGRPARPVPEPGAPPGDPVAGGRAAVVRQDPRGHPLLPQPALRPDPGSAVAPRRPPGRRRSARRARRRRRPDRRGGLRRLRRHPRRRRPARHRRAQAGRAARRDRPAGPRRPAEHRLRPAGG